jgi:hypothetical protein
MEKLYLISGLGADKRLFRKLEVLGYEFVHCDWIEPEKKDTIHTYAQKLIDHYQISPGANVLGVSLGGVMTVEISSIILLKKAIIISSIKSAQEIPWYFALFRRLPVYKIIPQSFYGYAGAFIKPLFGKMNQEEWRIFKNMIDHTSPVFMQWAMHAILHWKPRIPLCKIHHLMGTKDFIFSWKLAKDPDVIVPGGTHDMVYLKGREISEIVQKILTS